MKVLVCGGRDFADVALLRKTLDEIHSETGITKLVHGGATGADTLAAQWAMRRGVRRAVSAGVKTVEVT